MPRSEPSLRGGEGEKGSGGESLISESPSLPLSSSIGSPKFSSARAFSAASASAASGPSAVTTISSPCRTPSVATWLMLLALAMRAPLLTRTSVSNCPAVVTKRAAGRAWSPSRLPTSRVIDSPPLGGGSAGGAAGASGSPPSCSRLTASALSASASTCSTGAPTMACTAAAMAPSTSGAWLRKTRARCSSGKKSSAVSALSSALPKSISTTTPSSL